MNPVTKWCLWLFAVAVLAIWTADVFGSEPVLLDFYADWCGPCREMSATVDQLTKEGYRVQRVDVERERTLAARYRVNKIPSFVLVADNREVDRIVGLATIGDLRRMIDRHHSPTAATRHSGQPRPAWRYEHPTGRYASVVRVVYQENSRTRSLGSGVVVRWAGRVVILTARHVVGTARTVLIRLFNGREYRATVLKVDGYWDCAVLQPVETMEGVEPAEIEFGEAAMQHDGDRLESCGLGPDGKLAVNGGRFLGYRKSSQSKNTPDDWMVISGHARGGDSGGPVFNERGRVVGILWGTDSREVVCVQPGRLHATIAEAVKFYHQNSTTEAGRMVPVAWGDNRNPTPPLPEPPCCPVPGNAMPVADEVRQYIIPFRNEITQQQRELAGQVQTIQGQIGQVQQQIGQLTEAVQSQQQLPPVVQPPPVAEPPKEEPAEGGPKTAAGRIAERGADWLAEHGGPLSGKIAAGAAEKLDSDSPAVRFVGWTQAKAAWAVFLGAIVAVIAIGVFLLHRLNSRLLPILAAKAAATANPLDDKLVTVLRRAHDRIGAVEDRIKSRVSGGSDATANESATVDGDAVAAK